MTKAKKNTIKAFCLLIVVFSVVAICNKPPTPEDEARAAKTKRQIDAEMNCMSVVQERAKFGTEVDFGWMPSEYNETEANSVVLGTAKLMNSFGAMIPHTFNCFYEIKDGKVTLVDFKMWEG